jgi:hypothetical protein
MKVVSRDSGLSALENVGKRCHACGQRFSASMQGGARERCGDCLAANRPIDLVMRWIWADEDAGSPH